MFITARNPLYCVPITYRVYRYCFRETVLPDYAVFNVYSFDIEVVLLYSAN